MELKIYSSNKFGWVGGGFRALKKRTPPTSYLYLKLCPELSLSLSRYRHRPSELQIEIDSRGN